MPLLSFRLTLLVSALKKSFDWSLWEAELNVAVEEHERKSALIRKAVKKEKNKTRY